MEKNTQEQKQAQQKIPHSRKHGKKPSYAIPVWNGILEPRHRRKIGHALWEFLWLIDKITVEEGSGVDTIGWCLGKTPIELSRIARDLGVHLNTVTRNVATLDDFGYLIRKRTPRGYVIGVTNSRKFGIWKPKSDTQVSVDQSEVIHNSSESDPHVSVGRDTQVSVDARHLHSKDLYSKDLYSKETRSKTLPHEPREARVEPISIPDWITPETWANYLEHRHRRDRKPLSVVTQKLAMKELEKLRIGGEDPTAVIERSILNNWAGFFPSKKNGTQRPLTDDERLGLSRGYANTTADCNSRCIRNAEALGRLDHGSYQLLKNELLANNETFDSPRVNAFIAAMEQSRKAN